MNKKYIAGAAIVGTLFIGGGWVFQSEGTTPSEPSSSGQVYSAPAQTQAPKNGDGPSF